MSPWTLVQRARGARFYRPVGNVPTGLDWHGARELAPLAHELAVAELGATVRRGSYSADDSVRTYYVPRHPSHAEDVDNILEDDGRRVPIRWNAAPLVTLPAVRSAAELAELTTAARDRARDARELAVRAELDRRNAELDAPTAANPDHLALLPRDSFPGADLF